MDLNNLDLKKLADSLILTKKNAEEIAEILQFDYCAMSYAAERMAKLFQFDRAISMIAYGAHADTVIFQININAPEFSEKAEEEKQLFYKNRYLRNPEAWLKHQESYRESLQSKKTKNGKKMFREQEVAEILINNGWGDYVKQK